MAVSVRTQPTKILIGPILFLYYEKSLVSTNLNSKQLRFHGFIHNVWTNRIWTLLIFQTIKGQNQQREASWSSKVFRFFLKIFQRIFIEGIFRLWHYEEYFRFVMTFHSVSFKIMSVFWLEITFRTTIKAECLDFLRYHYENKQKP